jgi:hypothetical protein
LYTCMYIYLLVSSAVPLMQMINVLGRRNTSAIPVTAYDDETDDFPETDSNVDESEDVPKQRKLKTKMTVKIQNIDDGKGNASKGGKKKSGLVVERMKSRSLVRTYLQASNPDIVLMLIRLHLCVEQSSVLVKL